MHGAFYVICLSKPARAGEMAVNLCNSINKPALVCATPDSTSALSIGIPVEQLIVSDWRIPGADAPVKT